MKQEQLENILKTKIEETEGAWCMCEDFQKLYTHDTTAEEFSMYLSGYQNGLQFVLACSKSKEANQEGERQAKAEPVGI